MEHARHDFELMGGAGETLRNLEQSIQIEADAASRYYPQAAETAEKEGFVEVTGFFRRMSRVESRHEQHFRDVKAHIEKGAQFEGRTVGHSLVEMAQVMLRHQANPAGFVHGGELMKI
jgi:rubrerythrin